MSWEVTIDSETKQSVEKANFEIPQFSVFYKVNELAIKCFKLINYMNIAAKLAHAVYTSPD